MNTQIDDLTLIKCLGKGSFGEVYLSSKRGKPGYFATKKISRSQADQPSMKKYLVNEIEILNSLHHPNIVRLEEVKQKNDFYYIVMEYINGGSLTDCLKSYQKKFGNSFPEEIVQYLMRQIVDAIKYIHNLKIIHRDLKLDNIMVNFDNDYDKNSLNMMKAKIKIIDFGFAIRLTKNNLAYTALGSPINMDPTILRKFSNRGQDLNSLGYDSKSDIWSLGTICYEMLIGKAVFNAETMNELVEKVEEGSYKVPTTVSSEIVSFLNGMLQFNSQLRFSADELSKHAFLTKRISDFTKINTKKVSKKIDKKDLNINIKRNNTIWSIFNKEDEQKLINIKGGKDLPAPEGPLNEEYYKRYKRSKTEKIVPTNKNPQYNNNPNNFNKKKSSNIYPSYTNSFYGQSMHSNIGGANQMSANQIPNMQQYPGMPQYPSMQQLPGMPQYPGMQQMPGMTYSSPPMNYPTFGVPSPSPYPYGGMPNNNYGPPNPSYPYPPGNMPKASNYPPGYSPYNNNEVDEDGATYLIQ